MINTRLPVRLSPLSQPGPLSEDPERWPMQESPCVGGGWTFYLKHGQQQHPGSCRTRYDNITAEHNR